MASTFFGIEIAKTGLFMAQKCLNLTGHNISNVDTAGYSRQRIITESIDPSGVNVRFALTDKGRVGGGVQLQTLERIRDKYVDRQIRRENSTGGEMTTMQEALLYIETMFDTIKDTSIQGSLAKFFDSLQELSKDTANESLRINVREKADELTYMFHTYYDKLLETQVSMNEHMSNTVDRINTLTERLAQLNEQIYRYEITGDKANDLRDKRDLLLDELSMYVDIQYEEYPDPPTSGFVKFRVTMASDPTQVLADHTTARKLYVDPTLTDPITGQTGLFVVKFVDNNAVLNYKSGELEGYRKMRDGNTQDEYGVPYIINKLNTLAKALVTEINAIHTDGFTIPYDTNPSADMIEFFDSTKVTAKDISLSADILASVWNIACAEFPVTNPQSVDQKGDNKNILKILTLISQQSVTNLNGSGFEGYLETIHTELGAKSERMQALFANQSTVLTNLYDKRESISGVNIDEEVTLMMQFQHMYEANSRMLTALDEALDILINRTGIVGR